MALTALKSKDGSYGDYSHLKPADSKVKLYRDRNQLEIVFLKNLPDTNINIDCIFYPLFFSFSAYFFYTLFTMVPSLYGFIISLMFSLLFSEFMLLIMNKNVAIYDYIVSPENIHVDRKSSIKAGTSSNHSKPI